MRLTLPLYVCTALVVSLLAGCQAPEANRVPWWRGIPACLTSANSLEAEMWRRQHGYAGQGPPMPSRDFVGPLDREAEGIRAPEPSDEPLLEPPMPPPKPSPKSPFKKSVEELPAEKSSRAGDRSSSRTAAGQASWRRSNDASSLIRRAAHDPSAPTADDDTADEDS